MKSKITKLIKATFAITAFAAITSMTGCAVRVAPASPVVVQKRHHCHRNCRVHHPHRRHARPAKVVVIKR